MPDEGHRTSQNKEAELALRKLITPPLRNDKAKPSYRIFLFGTK